MVLSNNFQKNQTGDQTDDHAKEATDHRTHNSANDKYQYSHAKTLWG